ncbi:MAG: precorrin-2 C(20)-methyltransferase [Clostridiales bacterium]|nr:MAG: precorrin-2 C(20)-methyltransferase [Clostridiales bacterium]
MGILYGIGVGPGDPMLMTLKAVEAIKKCDIIAIPSRKSVAYEIAVGAVPEIEEKPKLYLDMPMIKDVDLIKKKHLEVANIIIENLDKNIGFLTLGDPSIYSTFSYINDIVSKDYETVVIPGITSFSGAAALSNEALVQWDESLYVIPSIHDDSLVLRRGTNVFMKSGKSLSELREKLASVEYKSIKIIEKCGMEEEKVYEDFDSLPEKLSYFTLVVIKV